MLNSLQLYATEGRGIRCVAVPGLGGQAVTGQRIVTCRDSKSLLSPMFCLEM
jgi:hypothetical protein